MAKTKSFSPLKNPGIVLVVTFFVLWTVNALIVYLSSRYFPRAVVLGTANITPGWALIHAVGTLALLNTFAIPFVREIERVKGRRLTAKEWMVKYFILNFVAVWAIARLADNLGFGISSWRVAFVLALVLDFAQGAAMMKLEKLK
ncbi:MAG: hypothetical protein UX85_C0004G0191 [Candidatus Beckwithbacteria bacterium GW2011_GWB1_47_15]|uniref:Uncharacterized protein n=1 Tax=Candidatus Beckwithbacteria bacterium GW2011_GWB1_47_15 TaxID=1618371 RepID=A0A0G1RVD6_9BACT|nr:MAG: hypothetical protein UY43_C0001G0044 [Candidatus Beckwithbacteria bacterium GW2011_GWC1_49_16]KKU34986.1 MAG: hypothetical protein UX50_C0007G0021 [Candidatus Beckwithbacteria bacterium GW2011_GWA1_46_30]KKU61269.1 MAG: hypothetical protein UX85_C0004G0191 [Candidatus Beckwithbacteria bacterium GW2011_GWB1_47_15]KKU71437.1 MAG: hypothetical protein UX97_C0006G0021 [Candidatus Beckwithbacteria bacterium GW2011_GWA2_47_25]KKW03075.1 MAG: hypothetical protein UY37_C0007G0029 [Candidatus Be